MKFVFSILAILVCGGAAYFTMTQTEMFEENQSKRFVAIDTNKQVEATIADTEAKIEEEKRLLEISKDNLATVKASIDSLIPNRNSLKTESAQLDKELAEQKIQFDDVNKAIAEIQEIMKDLGGDVNIDNIGEKIAEVEEDIKVKRDKVDKLNGSIEESEKSLATKQEEVGRLASRKEARNLRINGNAMEARVTAVDQDWGFLVIGAGSNSGFTPQTTLLVQRDGILIGTVKPSSIEPTQTIAEIDAKSLSPGVRIQPGDRVILAKPATN
jgi:myosin heavy subunit